MREVLEKFFDLVMDRPFKYYHLLIWILGGTAFLLLGHFLLILWGSLLVSGLFIYSNGLSKPKPRFWNGRHWEEYETRKLNSASIVVDTDKTIGLLHDIAESVEEALLIHGDPPKDSEENKAIPVVSEQIQSPTQIPVEQQKENITALRTSDIIRYLKQFITHAKRRDLHIGRIHRSNVVQRDVDGVYPENTDFCIFDVLAGNGIFKLEIPKASELCVPFISMESLQDGCPLILNYSSSKKNENFI